jgi:ADP-ribose pyrophosphatase YjhB (NUDIX family)
MGFLKLGVACAVFDDERRILLSKRGDFDVWNLPTGRLDKGEWLHEGARRETREETGVDVADLRPVGLYFQAGRARMNVLYAGKLAGGALRQQTDETQANRFFAPNDFPPNVFADYMAKDALAGGVHLHVLETPADELKRIRRKLAVRWLKNLLAGRPEPRWTRFGVQASLAVVNSVTGEVLSELYNNGQRVLMGLNVNGNTPIWEQVQRYVRDKYSLYELREASLRWAGVYHHRTKGALEFIFATEITPHSALKGQSLAWTPAESEAWWQGYRPFAQHIVTHPIEVKTVYEG